MFELSTYKRLLKQEEINCLECPSHKGGVRVKMPGTQLAQDLSITDQQTINWLNKESSLEVVDIINIYLQQNNNSEEAKEFVNRIISSGTEGSLVSPFPFFQYPLNSDYASKYPKLTEYLKNQLPKVKDIPLIINTIKDITGLTME